MYRTCVPAAAMLRLLPVLLVNGCGRVSSRKGTIRGVLMTAGTGAAVASESRALSLQEICDRGEQGSTIVFGFLVPQLVMLQSDL